jgi:hypothetical protein
MGEINMWLRKLAWAGPLLMAASAASATSPAHAQGKAEPFTAPSSQASSGSVGGSVSGPVSVAYRVGGSPSASGQRGDLIPAAMFAVAGASPPVAQPGGGKVIPQPIARTREEPNAPRDIKALAALVGGLALVGWFQRRRRQT